MNYLRAMANHLKCPSCGTVFDAEEALSADLELKLKKQYEDKFQENLRGISQERKRLEDEQKIFEEKRARENQIFQERLSQEKLRLEKDLKEQITRSIGDDYEVRMVRMQEQLQENERRMNEARQKELEFLRKEQELKHKEEELQIQLQKELLKAHGELSAQIRREETEKTQLKETEFQLKLRELEKQLEDQRKLADEMKRRAEQGSMQLQGEAQELLLEDMLRDSFPLDEIQEVGKGRQGADCALTVKNSRGLECGTIIFESKRTKNFSREWIEKLKADMRSTKADVAILVTQAFPLDMKCFGERDGIWICNFQEVMALTNALRHTLLRVADSRQSEENKGEKMQLLYNYLTGTEFRQQVETIVEGFTSMRNSIMKERMQMEKLWKEREKQIEKVLLSTSGMFGSIKGIAGASIAEIPMLSFDEADSD